MRIDHAPDKHDDRVIALALAAHHLAERHAVATSPPIIGRAPTHAHERELGNRISVISWTP